MQKIDDTLVEIFGNDTLEYRKYKIRALANFGAISGWGQPHPAEIIAHYREGVDNAKQRLQTIIDIFSEKIEDASAENGAVADDPEWNKEIQAATAELFRDGHYANAIEDGCKALDAMVQKLSGRTDITGTELMQTVFSFKNPILAFNALTSESDKSEQQGMMYLFAGAMLALRNPRAHQIIDDHPRRAQECLSFLNMLANSLARARKI